MSDRIQPEPKDAQAASFALPPPRLPSWLRHRLLLEGEQLEWVYGPGFNPWWERFTTHPLFFLVGATVGATWFGIALMQAGALSELGPLPALCAGAVVVGSLFIVGFTTGYFTRLIVTNQRMLITQGYELRRSWKVDDLPPSLIRYRRTGGPELSKTIDLDALHTMLGDLKGGVADSKTILALGRQLGNIRGQDEKRR